MTQPDLKELFRQAAEIAAEVPESMHDAAFNRALDLLLQKQGLAAPEPDDRRPKRRTPPIGEPDDRDPIDLLMDRLDRTRHPEITHATKVLDSSLFLLRACRDEHDVDGLNPVQIARILTEKFRIRTAKNAVSMALSSAGDKVDRTKKGAAYTYRLMSSGDNYLAALSDGTGTSTRKTAAGAGRKSERRRKATATGEKETVSAPRRQGGRPGPKRILEGLIDDGFFSDGRATGDIQEHLEKGQGRRYKATDLSPALLRLLREEKLTRGENADGQYEYTSR